MRSGASLRLRLPILLLALLLAVPMGLAQAPEDAPREVVIHVEERDCPDDAAPCFLPPAIPAAPHERLRLVFDLEGGMPHRIVAEGNDTPAPVLVDGTHTIHLTAPGPRAEVAFSCEIHPLTMHGVVSTQPTSIFSGDLRARANVSHLNALTVLATADGGPAAVRHEWDWGDGGRSEGPHATHRYARGGDWQVTLTTHDADGNAVTHRLPVATYDRDAPFPVTLHPGRDCPDGATRCWRQPTFAVPLGAPVRLALWNDDVASHRIRVLAAPANESAVAMPGDVVEVLLPALGAVVEFECPFHPGMQGSLRPDPMPSEGGGANALPLPALPLTLLAIALAARRRG